MVKIGSTSQAGVLLLGATMLSLVACRRSTSAPERPKESTPAASVVSAPASDSISAPPAPAASASAAAPVLRVAYVGSVVTPGKRVQLLPFMNGTWLWAGPHLVDVAESGPTRLPFPPPADGDGFTEIHRLFGRWPDVLFWTADAVGNPGPRELFRWAAPGRWDEWRILAPSFSAAIYAVMPWKGRIIGLSPLPDLYVTPDEADFQRYRDGVFRLLAGKGPVAHDSDAPVDAGGNQ